jgi:putative ABC transport system permease protein
MAIRLAIGARPRGVIALVLREALLVALVGTALGMGAALPGGRWLQSLLFQTSGTDPLVLTLAAVVMFGVATFATLVPARLASRADPVELLR